MDSRVAIGPALCKPSSRGGVELGRGQRGQPVTTWTRHCPGDRAPPAGPWHRATRRAWSPATSAPLVSGGARPRRGVGGCPPPSPVPPPNPGVAALALDHRTRSGRALPCPWRGGAAGRSGLEGPGRGGHRAWRPPRACRTLRPPPAPLPSVVPDLVSSHARARPGLLTCPGQLAPEADSAPLGIPCVAVTKRSRAGPRSPAGRRLTFAVTK